MQYHVPDPADLDHVHALNRQFLRHVIDGDFSRVLELPPGIADRLQHAREGQVARLARAPFLLCAIRESDERLWQRLFAADPHGDLLDNGVTPTRTEAQFAQTVTSYVWHLAKFNPYSARCVTGASLEWCAQLAAVMLTEVTAFAAGNSRLLGFRRSTDQNFWKKLLRAGTSSARGVRHAARTTALQAVLATAHEAPGQRLRAAACAMPSPSLSVAERRPVTKSGRRGYNTPLHESPVHQKSRKNLRKR